MTDSASCGPEDPGGSSSVLGRLLAEELGRGFAADVSPLVDEIRRRHPNVAAVLFYGSCLRKGTNEGVLDFYALVDAYRGAYAARWPAWLGAALPPNVHYLEVPAGPETLRAKYALITLADFRRAASPGGVDTRIWARFCQPSALAWVRDDPARQSAIATVEQATRTAVDRMRCFLPGDAPRQRFALTELWQAGFAETYGAEFRSEREQTVRGIVEADPERYRRVGRAALEALAEQGRLAIRDPGEPIEIESDPAWRARERRRWARGRVLAKGLAALALLKTAATFDGWVGYVLWKLERQSGVRIEVSERQRRHPLLFGWPVLFRLILRGVLR